MIEKEPSDEENPLVMQGSGNGVVHDVQSIRKPKDGEC